MDRKLMFVLAAALLVASAVAASAQNDSVGDDVKAFGSQLGARVRLLMLEASIERNILWGSEIVAAVEDRNSSADTSGLESVLAEMQALKDEVAAIDPGTGEEAAQEFVDIKSEAIDLTREFREEARGMLPPRELNSLRVKLGALKHGRVQSLKESINETKREYNGQNVEELLSSLGLSNPDLVDGVRNGDAKIGDVRKYIKDAGGNMSKDERKEAFLKLKEETTSAGVFMRAIVDKNMYKRVTRLQERMEKRLRKAGNLNVSDAALARIEKRIEVLGGRMGRVQNKTEARIAKIGAITSKRVERIEGIIEHEEDKSQETEDRLENRLQSWNITEEEEERVGNRLARIEEKSELKIGRLEAKKVEVEERGEKKQNRLRGNMEGEE
ncbi:MAG: hypothetical protein V1744_03565 [Candidatus Altiarchaeota archaeon]